MGKEPVNTLNAEYIVINEKQNGFHPKSSIAQKLLNKKRTFLELETENDNDDNDDDMEENPVMNGEMISFVDEDEDDESESKHEEDDKETEDNGNDFKKEIKSMMDNYDMNKDNIKLCDDDNIEPLWSY